MIATPHSLFFGISIGKRKELQIILTSEQLFINYSVRIDPLNLRWNLTWFERSWENAKSDHRSKLIRLIELLNAAFSLYYSWAYSSRCVGSAHVFWKCVTNVNILCTGQILSTYAMIRSYDVILLVNGRQHLLILISCDSSKVAALKQFDKSEFILIIT